MKIAKTLLIKSALISLIINLFSILQIVKAGQIFGEKIVVDYDYDGYAQRITLLVQFESSLSSLEVIQIQFPTNLGPYNQVFSSIYEQKNNLQLAGNVMADVTSKNNYYIFSYSTDLKANNSYRIEVTFINQIPNNLVNNDPISMTTMSKIGADAIIYDTNLSLFYLYIAPSIPTESLIVGIQLDSKPQEEYITDPGIIFSAFIDVTPSISNSQGGYYYIYIDVGPNVIGSQKGADFKFVGKCQSVENKCDSRQNDPNCQEIKQVKSKCTINNQTGRIELLQSDPIVAQKPIRIIVEIQNCLFTSQRDIKVYSASINDKRPMEKGRKQIALRVSEVQIQRKKVQYLWGLDENESIYSPYKLFKAAASPLAGPLNSIQVYFTIPTLVPEGSDLTVSLETGADGCLEHSIITNLPILKGKKKVSCYFDTGFIKCVNIGAFQDPSIEYFIAAKIFYKSTTANPTNFAGIKITSKVTDENGVIIPNIYLFKEALGQIVTLQQNTEYLDTSLWHKSSVWSLGTTQIISTPDDGTLSGVPNGINAILKGSQNTVGIIPNIESEQQLIFFLKVTSAQIGSANGKYYRMSVLFNPSVVKFKSGFENKGIDFAAYSNTKTKWELDKFKCYSPTLAADKLCVWYNKPQLQANRIDFTYNTLISNPYAFIRFECGKVTGGVNISDCDNFQGQGTADYTAGAFSMRNVYFDNKFQSSLYPDDKLLDFIITFEEKSQKNDPDNLYSTVSTQLINAYTIQKYRLSNIKVSYVNLYSHATANSNNGLYIPTMLRIGGSILRSESFELDKIHIFLDENVDATAFLENNTVDKSDHSIGCSQATCEYFANAGVSVPTDTWFNQKKIEITNLPNIQNEFNILIPITNLNNALPSRLVIAFTNSKYSTFGLGGLDNILNVFRVAGLPVSGKLETPILTINGISNNVLSLPNFNALWQEAGNTFNYKLDITKVGVQSTIDQTKLIGDASTTLIISQPSDPQMYGAGLTITSFTQNIFSISDIQFSTPPTTGAKKCTNFQYKLNSGTALERNNQYNYVVFCPIDDSSYKIDNTVADPNKFSIIIKDPNFPGFFVNTYDLSTVLSYGFSNNKGSLIAFNRETQPVTITGDIGKPWQCNTNSVTLSPHQDSKGRQKLEIVIPWNDSDIKIDDSMNNGYRHLNIKVTFSSITGITFLPTSANVECTNSQFNCAGVVTGSYIEFKLTPIDITQVYTIERSLNIVITTFAVFATPASPLTYTIDILIPTQKDVSGTKVNFLYGEFYNNVIYQSCASQTFTVDTTKYGEELKVSDVAFQIINNLSRSTFSFNFRSVSARQEFYATSSYIFTLGFLSSSDNKSLLLQNNLNCYVMERDFTTANSPFTISHKWNTLQIDTNFATITITPHNPISNPENYEFKIVCIGGSTTDGVLTTDLTAIWKDGTDSIQTTTTPFKFTDLGYTLPAKQSFTTQPTIVSRLFASPGMEAHYKLQIQIKTPLSVQSRIYIEFGFGFSPRINKKGRVECYITNSPNFDTQEVRQTLTLCEIINNRRLKVYANDLVSSVFYIDILGVSMPQKLPVNSVSRPLHWIGVDDDDDLTNGIVEQGTFLDTFPSQTAFSAMTCSNVYINQNIIRRAHSITFTIQTLRSNILATNIFYIDFPYQYDSINKGDIITCSFRRLDVTTYPSTSSSYISNPNLAKKCDFISLTRMRITLSKNDDQTLNTIKETYIIFVQNIISPSQAVSGLRFNIFACKNTDLNSILLIASDYGASEIAYVAETEKTDLEWNSIQLQQEQQNVVKTTNDYLYSYFSTVKYFNVYIGYYQCDIQLLPKSTTETKFKNTFSYTFSKYSSNFYFDNNSNTIETAMTGTSVSQFKLTAQSTTSPGIFTLHPPKSDGDTLQQYMDLPPLNLVVSTDKCQVNAINNNVYEIPADGQSLPVIFDFTNCYPAQSIIYTPTNDLADPTQLIVDSTTYQDTIDGTKGEWQTNYRMIMIFKPKTSNLIPVATDIKVTFTLGGYNLLSYIDPTPISLKITTAIGGSGVAPVASDIVIISQAANTITVEFSCDQPSVVLYQIGLEDKTAPEYKTILTKLTSSRDFYSDASDFDYYKQYGRLVVSAAGQKVQQTLSNLQSSSAYNLYYYCINQQPKESTVKKASFSISSNGGYLLKVILYFTDQITYAQNQDISCALSQVFSLNYQRVVNEQNVYCGGSYPYFIKDTTTKYKKTRSVNYLYSYSYYILQDKTLTQDLVNLSIKEIIQYRTFNETLLSRTTNPQLFPILQDPETEDILSQYKSTANLDVSTIDTNYAKITFTLVGQKGYMYIGILAGGQTIPFKNFLELKEYQSLLYFWSSYVPRDIEQSVTFTNLQPGTTYTIFYSATNDNPSIQALSTGVLSKQFSTKSIQIVVEVSSRRLLFSILLIALSLLL